MQLGTEHPFRRDRDANPVQNRGAHAFQRASAHGRRPRAARRNDFPPVSRFGGFTDNVGYCLRIDSFVGDPDGARILISQRPPLGPAFGTPQNACVRFAGVRKSLAFLEVDGKQPFFGARFTEAECAALAIVEDMRDIVHHEVSKWVLLGEVLG